MNIDDLLESERAREGFSPEQCAAIWLGIEQALGLGPNASPPAHLDAEARPRMARLAAIAVGKAGG